MAKELTADQKEAKKVAAAKFADKKVEAKIAVKPFIESITEDMIPEDFTLTVPELKASLHFLCGTGTRATRTRVPGESKVSVPGEILDMLKEAGEAGVSGMTLYGKFEVGAPKMQSYCNNYIKNPEPEDRIWVEKSIVDGIPMYTIIAEGEDAPEGWDGYVPSVKESLDDLPSDDVEVAEGEDGE